MKPQTATVVAVSLFILLCVSTSYAVSCKPRFSGTWTVEDSCDMPAASYITINGDMRVFDRTVNLPTGVQLGVNLSTNKITFTTGKILLAGTSKIQGIAGYPYKVPITYTHNAPITNCSSYVPGSAVLNSAGTDFAGSREYRNCYSLGGTCSTDITLGGSPLSSFNYTGGSSADCGTSWGGCSTVSVVTPIETGVPVSGTMNCAFP